MYVNICKQMLTVASASSDVLRAIAFKAFDVGAPKKKKERNKHEQKQKISALHWPNWTGA